MGWDGNQTAAPAVCRLRPLERSRGERPVVCCAASDATSVATRSTVADLKVAAGWHAAYVHSGGCGIRSMRSSGVSNDPHLAIEFAFGEFVLDDRLDCVWVPAP